MLHLNFLILMLQALKTLLDSIAKIAAQSC